VTNPCLRDGTEVGGWLLKANPQVWDIATAIERGVELDWWRLRPSYRVNLVLPGQPCSLWITASSAHPAGLWAIGEIRGVPELDVGDPEDNLWCDEVAQREERPYVAVHLELLSAPLLAVDLRSDPRLSRAEIFRAPRMGSPLAWSVEEWSAVNEAASFLLRD
jgi:hypothetical protein